MNFRKLRTQYSWLWIVRRLIFSTTMNMKTYRLYLEVSVTVCISGEVVFYQPSDICFRPFWSWELVFIWHCTQPFYLLHSVIWKMIRQDRFKTLYIAFLPFTYNDFFMIWIFTYVECVSFMIWIFTYVECVSFIIWTFTYVECVSFMIWTFTYMECVSSQLYIEKFKLWDWWRRRKAVLLTDEGDTD